MKRFEDFQTEWNQYMKENPSLVKELEQKVAPMLLNSDEDFLRQGIELLSSIGSFAFCLLLEEDASQIKSINTYPNLSRWKVKALKDVLRSLNVKVSGRKKELVERINNDIGIRLRIESCVIEEVSKEDSAWFGLFDSGSFDEMFQRTMENTEWSSLSENSQQRLLQEVGQMVEVPGRKYFIGKYLATQALWESVMGNNPSKFNGSSRPVESVSWMDCVLFCNKLSEQEGLEKVYSLPVGLESELKNQMGSSDDNVNELSKEVSQNLESNGYRLSTEWEWWFAAKSNDDFTYSGSNNIDEVAWYDKNSNKETHGVGQKKANGFGLYDISGNVWEWCSDWYGESDPTEDSTGPSTGSFRVRCGGSWFDIAYGSYRIGSRPSYRFNRLGFRLTRTIR